MFLHAEVQALFLIGKLAGAVAVALKLGKCGLDLRLHRGDEVLGVVRLGTGGTQRCLDVCAGFAGAHGLLLLFLELHFLLGDAAVDLVQGFVGGGEIEFLLRQLFPGGGNVGMVLGDAAFELRLALVVEGDAGFRAGKGRAVLVELLAEFGKLGFEKAGGGACLGNSLFLFRELALEMRVLRIEGADRIGQLGALPSDLHIALVGEVRVENTVIGGERLEAAGLCHLALQGVHAALLLREDVGNPEQVRLGVFEFAEGVLFLALELRDASRFFEDGAALLGLGGEDLVDLTLRHDRIGGAADAGVHEQIVEIAQPAKGAVETVFRAAVAEHPAGDGDLVEIHFQRLLAIRHRQGDLRHAERLAFLGAVENDIRHLAAAQCLRGGFTEHPADRIDNVGLAATVRPDNAGDSFGEFEHGSVGKGFETLDFEGLEIHVGGWSDVGKLNRGRARIGETLLAFSDEARSQRRVELDVVWKSM